MLADVAINAFKSSEKPYKKSDGGGLFLPVQPNDSKIWRFAYRFEDRQKLLSGGPFPQTSLATARAWRKKMKAPARSGSRSVRGAAKGVGNG